MSRRQIALLGSLTVIAVVVWAVVVRTLAPAVADAGDGRAPSPTVAATLTPASASAPLAGAPSASVALLPSPTPAPTDTPRSTPVATATQAPTQRPSTDRPETTEAAQVAYVRFLARLAEDRSTVADLNQRLADAGESGDRATARTTAIDILRFVDGERDWLAAHPPADCFATAHAAANTMLEAYGTVADRAIDWADAEGLEVFASLADLLAAGDTARDALSDLANAVERTTCPA
jgi:hypothetical protein